MLLFSSTVAPAQLAAVGVVVNGHFFRDFGVVLLMVTLQSLLSSPRSRPGNEASS